LRKHGYDVRRRLLYETDKQRRAGWRFIEHRVGITDFMVQLELACRTRQDLTLIERKEVVETSARTNRDRRVRLTAKIWIDGARSPVSVDPDEFFGLRFRENSEERYFMFELDRGEMPVIRHKSKEQTYFAKKLMVYHEANRVGEHVRGLGIPNFRVATVTTSAERVAQMIEAQNEITNGRGSNMFLFVDRASLAASNPLDVIWTTGKGRRVRITD
jgi:hypothetical protein